MNKDKDPKNIEYWKRIFPDKTEKDLERMKEKWSKSEPLKFPRL